MRVALFYDNEDTGPSGGGKQLYRMADVLNAEGFDARVVHAGAGERCSWFRNETRVERLADLELGPDDFLVLPETAKAVPAFRGSDRCRKVVYVQNPYNVFLGMGGNPGAVRAMYLSAAGVLCQSRWTEECVRHYFPEARVHAVRYSFDRPPFSYGADKQKVVAYMTRKGGGAASNAVWLLARNDKLSSEWRLEAIDGKTEEQVAEVMGRSAVFMATGYYEGFCMPPAEAMACGCAVVGFPGFAGEEYMLPEHSWPVRDQDPMALAMEVEAVLSRDLGELKYRGKKASDYIRSAYSTEKEVEGIVRAWRRMAGPVISVVADKKEEKMEERRTKVKAVVMSHDMPENVDKLFGELALAFDDVEVFDSGSAPDKVPRSATRSFPNIYWTGLWDEVRRTCRGYDAVWVLGGDVQLKAPAAEYRKALESSMPFGCWSPAVEGQSRPYMQAAGFGGEPRRVNNIEGIAMAVSGELLEKMGEFPKGCQMGYGQDLWMCWRARELGMFNVVDGRVPMFHPPGTGYDTGEAERQMEETFSALLGPEWRKAFRYSDLFDGNVVDFPAKDKEAKEFVVATVDNGWGLADFRRIVGQMDRTRGVVVAKGLLRLPDDGKLSSVLYSELGRVAEEAGAFLFSRVGEANREDYERLLRAGIPMVVHKSFDMGLIEHMVDGFVFYDDTWALRWLSALRDEPGRRDAVAAAWKAKREAAAKQLPASPPELGPAPKVSVVTPTYKRDPKVLSRAISCMLLQTEASWEQLVCSDGGREASAEEVVRAAGDPRVSYSFTEGKKEGDFGNTVRKEMLEKRARGEYVLFLDDDNVILPNYLEEMVGRLEGAPDCGFAVCRVMHFGPLNEALVGKPPKVLSGEPVALYHVDPLQVLVRRKAMLEIGWDTEVGYLSDGVTLEKLGKKFKHVRVDIVLGVHI